MEEKVKNKEGRYWDKISKFYDPVMTTKEAVYDILNGLITRRLESNMNVLDVAAGTGAITLPIAEQVSHVTACDLSASMLEIAKSKAERMELTNLTFEVQDAYDLPYLSETFDIVVIANALHIMKEPERALKEARRVLKKDGMLIAPTFILNTSPIGKGISQVMTWTGYHCYHQWTGLSLKAFVEDQYFRVIQSGRISGAMPLQYIVAIKDETIIS